MIKSFISNIFFLSCIFIISSCSSSKNKEKRVNNDPRNLHELHSYLNNFEPKDKEAKIACDKTIAKLLWIETADPIKDVTLAIAQKKYRYQGVRGFTIFLPGVEDKFDNIDTVIYKVIDGTSDGLCSSAHLRLNFKAEEYAKTFNTILYKFLEEKPLNK